jgi:PadR family transcriptional regulator, regulatory protein AphA
VQSGTAYDLAQRMKTNHHFIWSRAESKLYEEVKRLHELGLVSAEHETTGRRARTVYGILPLGERALTAWIAMPSAEPSLSFEALVKLAYADFGTVEEARAHVRSMAELAERWITLGRTLADAYLQGRVELPQRAHTNVLAWRFLAGYGAALLDWANVADAALARWDGTKPSKKNAEITRELFADGLRVLDRASRGAAGRKRRELPST